MKILNLIDLDKSDIKYQIQKFPDGQQNIVIPIATKLFNGVIQPIQIKSRLNNWLDLELITCTVACLYELDITEIHLYVPYIMGARSDRKFEEGGNNYVKHVIAPAINHLNFKSVTCLDPHSDVLEACIKNFRKETNIKLVESCFYGLMIKNNTIKTPEQTFTDAFLENIILISPDAGANKKIYKVADKIGYKGDIITCSKDRDKDGKLTKTIVPLLGKYESKNFIIIDDICDGGATFINIAKCIKEWQLMGMGNGKIYLIITHGIFSKGFGELQQYFDYIYTTNSYKQLHPDTQSFVKQLNVF